MRVIYIMAKDFCDICTKRFFERELFNTQEGVACHRCLIELEREGLLDDTPETDEEISSWTSPGTETTFSD